MSAQFPDLCAVMERTLEQRLHHEAAGILRDLVNRSSEPDGPDALAAVIVTCMDAVVKRHRAGEEMSAAEPLFEFSPAELVDWMLLHLDRNSDEFEELLLLVTIAAAK
jgi:hypothetical protein